MEMFSAANGAFQRDTLSDVSAISGALSSRRDGGVDF